MSKIRIMHVIGTMDRGGSETYLMNILRLVDSNNYKFYFLCFSEERYDYEEEIICLGHEIIRIQSLRKSGVILHVMNVYKKINKHKIDAVETHIYPNAFYYLFASLLAGTKIRIAHSHTARPTLNETIIRKFYNTIARKLNVSISNIRVACGVMAGVKAFGGADFIVINNFIDINRYKFSEQNREDYRKKICVDESSILIGNVARFESVKNHDYMIRLIKEIAQHNDGARLLLVGDGPEKEKIMLLTKKLGLEKNVIFYGKTNDTAELYSAMDIFILPSLWEGMPLTLVEAQANGLKCVASANVDRAADITGQVKFVATNDTNLTIWVDEIAISTKNERAGCEVDLSDHDVNSNYNKALVLYGAQKK